jgi:hypothetical protein
MNVEELKMVSSEQNDEVSDTTDDDSSNAAGNIYKHLALTVHLLLFDKLDADC